VRLRVNLLRLESVFPLIMGLADGILTALTLAAGRVFSPDEPIGAGLMLRLAVGASFSGAFVYFVADYARRRLELVHAERHLTLNSRGRLASTHLGRAVFEDALRSTVTAGVSSFLGAIFPLLFAVRWPAKPWLAILVSIIALGLLGSGLARSLHANVARWTVSLMLLGAAVTWLGHKLHIL
jgi:predicted membrane protein (TIGR00267 family)